MKKKWLRSEANLLNAFKYCKHLFKLLRHSPCDSMKINVANESLSSVPRDPFKWLYTAQINKKILLKTFSFLFLSVF